ncbi:hypothetical protein DFH06DRAFT_1212676 [Mycena polygramma]|nr:hypothetical protein DFH06DRAFT_1212676 [Mycena polygramma]
MDVEKQRIEEARDNPEHEAAAAKLWAVYISEAEKYDKGLVESWKSDMQGMLIFAGLFSASLTAFLVESYQGLSRDSGDDTVRLLAQISQQLAAAANGTNFVIPLEPPFTPTASSLICNTLWFTSLGLSLACALIATLLDQWARDFLHRTEIRPSPVIRARVFSFLYYGLKRFKMHSVVEIIPLLLHASLLLFFAGLVAFLIPVNTVVMCVTAILLVFITSVYSLLTILPSLCPDCPYRTPLSGTFWQVLQKFNTAWTRANLPSDAAQQVTKQTKTLIEHMLEKAREDSDVRTSRDRQALIWTVKSLADDAELEPFVEAIPDVIWDNHDKRRYVYDDHIRCLMEDPNIQLFGRILGLLDSCGSGLLSHEASTRRRISCYKALWTLSSLAICTASVPSLPFVPGSLSLEELDPELRHYAVSVNVLIKWMKLKAAEPLLDDLSKFLVSCKADTIAARSSDIRPIQSLLDKLREYSICFHTPTRMETTESLAWVLAWVQSLMAEVEVVSLTTLMACLMLAADQSPNLIPYRFALTQKLIGLPKRSPRHRGFLLQLQSHLDHLVSELMVDVLANEQEHWLDRVFEIMLSYWDPEVTDSPAEALPWGVIHYLNHRSSTMRVLRYFPTGAWKSVAETIYHPPRPPFSFVKRYPDVLTESLTLVWRLLARYLTSGPDIPILEAILEAALNNETPPITRSLVALARTALMTWAEQSATPDLISNAVISKFPPETSFVQGETHDDPPRLVGLRDFRYFKRRNYEAEHRSYEARIQILAMFIESCCSSELPFEAANTTSQLGHFQPKSTIHPTHQLRFANAVRKLVEASRESESSDRDRILQNIIYFLLLKVYAHPEKKKPEGSIAWLDDTEAREVLKETITVCVESRSDRAQEIVAYLDHLHPVEGREDGDVRAIAP